MKLSFNWLSEYIDIPYDTAELAEKITMAGIEVEAIETIGAVPDGVVVGEILERSPHPDADRLSVCRVSDGTNELQIVCGAPNCDAGNKVPLATIGTVFADPDGGKDFVIKKGRLRGVDSHGMLCSAKELGLGEGREGLMLLDAAATKGLPLKELFQPDTVFELEITPNRPDWLSHWGVARDIAALIGIKAEMPEFTVPAGSGPAAAGLVEVLAPGLCPRYTARVIRGVKVEESPGWLKARLEAIGLRPINNVVDITNFVLHELGHPLHAFDLNALEGGRIIVRLAGNGERIVTLDGDEHELTDSQLVICDAAKPVALAGVMGGEHSGVTGDTVDILLESAVFNSSNIRSTSRGLGISSDSSYRFERGVDWNMARTAADRAAAMIIELAGGEVEGGFIDVSNPENYPRPRRVVCRFQKIRSLLGEDIANEKMVEIFRGLGMGIENITDSQCLVTATSYRLDIEREADLAEEVMRIYGLDKLPNIPVAATCCAPFKDDSHRRIETAANQFIALGLNQCVNYTLLDDKSAALDARFAESEIIAVDNPISQDLKCLRPSLLADMLRVIEHNQSRGNNDLRLFEIGRVFCGRKGWPEERREFCVAMTGRRHPERFSSEKDGLCDFYDLKGVIEGWLETRGVHNAKFNSMPESHPAAANFAAGQAAVCAIDDDEVIILGLIHQRLTAESRGKTPLFLSLGRLDKILAAEESVAGHAPVPKFPSISRDIAFIADKTLEHQTVLEFIFSQNVKNFESIELFDIYEGENLPEGKKSMAYSLKFRNPERTLTDKEVNKAHDKLRARLADGLSVELR